MAEQPPQVNQKSSLSGVERKAAWLLLAVCTLLIAFVVFVLYARGVFEDTQQLVLTTDDSEGVIAGMDLTFSGFPIGRVRRIELAADGKVRIILDVASNDAHWLRSSSIFTLERGLVGDTRIRAFTGLLSDPPLPPDAERGLLRGDTAAEIPRLVASMRSLLENLESMTRSDSAVNSSLEQLHAVTEKLNGRYGLLGGMLGSDENAAKIISALDRTNALLAKTDQRIYGPHGVMEGTQAVVDQLHAVLSDARASLQKVDAVLEQAQGLVGQAQGVMGQAQAIGNNARLATTDLGALRAEVESSLRKVNQLVDELNRKWPFARDSEIRLP
jgi:phospholipid/cholesterol/gamma-HCH transport system substrate-binding protein